MALKNKIGVNLRDFVSQEGGRRRESGVKGQAQVVRQGNQAGCEKIPCIVDCSHLAADAIWRRGKA